MPTPIPNSCKKLMVAVPNAKKVTASSAARQLNTYILAFSAQHMPMLTGIARLFGLHSGAAGGGTKRLQPAAGSVGLADLLLSLLVCVLLATRCR